MNWTITDNSNLIQIEREGLEVFNNPKSDTEIKIVRAKSGDNTSDVDKLYIGADTSWPCQIPWNDVTVDGDTPTDVDDFSDLVEVILNNVSGGSGDMTAAVYDARGYAAQVTVRDIQTTRNACIALLATGSNTGADITAGQGYVFDGLDGAIPTGISMIRVQGCYNLTGKGFELKARALVTKLSKWFDCNYNLVTGEISGDYLLWAGYLTQTGSSDPTVDSTVMNNLPEVPTFASQGYPGKYWIVTSASLFNVAKHSQFHSYLNSSGDFFANPEALFTYEDSANKIGFFTGLIATDYFDGLMNNTYIEFRQRF